MQRTGSLKAPDVPMACVRCGTPYGLTRQPLLVRLGGSRIRHVDVPFCPRCWRMHESTRSVVFVAVGAAVAAVVVGAVVSAVARDWVPAVASAVVGLATLVVALVIRRNALPVVKRVSREETVLEVPGVGEVRVRVEE